MTPPLYQQRWLRVACWVAFGLGLVINLLIWSYPRGEALGNGHSFRQFQTAITARYLVRDGFKVDYETPVLGPPWSIPMEFPLYEYAVAAVVRLTGISLELSGRLVSMGFFWGSLPAVWLLLGRWLVPRETRLLALALLLTCPVYLFYGRHFMIETTALALGLWFLWAFGEALHRRSLLFGVVALVLGSVAGLAKITTFFSFGVGAALLMAVEICRQPRAWWRLLVASAAIMLPALLLTWLWVQHTDRLKELNPVGNFLVSTKLHDFNFGPAAQRLEGKVWLTFLTVTRTRLATDLVLMLGLIGLVLTTGPRRWLAGASLTCYVVVLGVFTNLFFVHDYYFEATAVFLLVSISLGLESLLNQSRIPAALRGLALALVLVSQLAGFWRVFGNQFTSPPPESPPLAPIIRQITDPEDAIIVIGEDWNARFLYFCDRRGLMVPNGYELRRTVLRQSVYLLGNRRIGALVIAGDFRNHTQDIISLTRMMQLAPRAIIAGQDRQVYLRKDRLDQLPTLLAGGDYPGFKINREYDPTKDILNSEHETDLTGPEWAGKFPMATPAPHYLTTIFPINLTWLNDTPIIGIHAPNSLFFQPPAGASHLHAVGGMLPGSYTGKEFTDGVSLEVWESLPDGNQLRLFQRTLQPIDHREDRAEVTIDIALDRPFLGELSLRVDPGPAGSINYDWTYWRSIRLY